MSKEHKKYSSIGRIKKVTNKKTGSETLKLEFTQGLTINRNAVAYVNDYVGNVDRLLESGAIDVIEADKRKSLAKQTVKAKDGTEFLVETVKQIMLDVESNKVEESSNKF
jgi:hypothetical protein